MSYMTDTPKRRRGRPAGPGKKLSEEHKAKLAEAARRQHADPEAHARWRAGMEPVWARLRGDEDEPEENPTADENGPEAGTR